MLNRALWSDDCGPTFHPSCLQDRWMDDLMLPNLGDLWSDVDHGLSYLEARPKKVIQRILWRVQDDVAARRVSGSAAPGVQVGS